MTQIITTTLQELSKKTMDKVAIFVPDSEAKQFLLFQQYFEPFTTLVDAGVFHIRNGSAVLHFDSEGVLQLVNRADVLYSRKHHT